MKTTTKPLQGASEPITLHHSFPPYFIYFPHLPLRLSHSISIVRFSVLAFHIQERKFLALLNLSKIDFFFFSTFFSSCFALLAYKLTPPPLHFSFIHFVFPFALSFFSFILFS
ncbi:hypothetical protein VNO78_03258 [Psophocarpus tetragonolobus]|uniref:Transmembrane protein n=1 Tax=Psophocarpus tetragonolobus TaxID=3891 RepID=A0AAN9T409_PSOTE